MFTVPPLTGDVDHDDAPALIGTLAPTGGAAPYEVVLIGPGHLAIAADAAAPAGEAGAPTLAQSQVLAAASATAPPGVSGAPALGQRHALSAASATAPAGVAGAPDAADGYVIGDWGVMGVALGRRPSRVLRAARPARAVSGARVDRSVSGRRGEVA
jgi:hypothetical protein